MVTCRMMSFATTCLYLQQLYFYLQRVNVKTDEVREIANNAFRKCE